MGRVVEMTRRMMAYSATMAHRLTSSSTVESYEKVAYSYAEEAAYLTVLWVALVGGIVYFLLRYANRSLFKWHTWINIFMGYFNAIALITLIPLDLALIKMTREAGSNMQYAQLTTYSQNLYSIYGVFFWMTQIFANILLYFFEEYNESGYFTVATRVGDSIVQILKFLALAMVAGVIFLAVLMAGGYTKDQSALVVTLIALNNTYGLVVIVFLLGYGLVELPKQMWMDGNLQGKLRRLRGRAAVEFRHLTDASCDISEIIAHTLKTKAEIEKLKEAELIAYMPKIMKLIPEDARSTAGGTVQKNKKGKVTRHTLAALRKEIKLRKAKFEMCQGRVERIKRQVFNLEDIVASKHRSDKVARIKYASGRESSVTRFILECYVKPIMRRTLSLLVIGMCMSVLLAEVGLMAGESSSVAVLSRAAHNPSVPPAGLIVLLLFYIVFICWVMLFALSQLRVADIMEIVPEQKTTPRSMSFNARLCCRLAPPLAYNFLTLCFESGVETGPWMNSALTGQQVLSAFSRFYGSMDVIPLLGKNFNLVIPIFVLILAVLQALNIFNRILRKCGLASLQFGEPPIEKKDLEEGLKKLQKYRQQMEQQLQREERMKNLRVNNPALKIAPSDIDNITAADNDDDNSDAAGGSSMLSSSFDVPKWTSSNPPPPREGWMAKKTGHEKAGGGWSNRYFVLRDNGVLVQYKKQDKMGPTLGTLDLGRVLSVSPHAGKDGRMDMTRINVDTPEGTMKLRCSSEESANEWRRSLMQWKDYALSQKMAGAGGGGAAAYPLATKDDDTGNTGGSTLLLPQQQSSSSSSSIGAGGRLSLFGSVAEVMKPKKGGEEAFTVVAPGGGSTGGAGIGTVTRGSRKSPNMPKHLSGKLQMLNGMFGYTERSFTIKAVDQSLKYYKAGETTGSPLGSVDMKLVQSIAFEEKNGVRDPVKFVVVVQGLKEPLKLKAETPQEAERWINGLNEWSLFFKAADANAAAAGGNRNKLI